MNMYVLGLVIYFFIINLFAIFLMKYDKVKAINNQYRVSEKTLFLIALILGGIGIYIGMYLFRHKTKHVKFTVGIPLIIILNINYRQYLERNIFYQSRSFLFIVLSPENLKRAKISYHFKINLKSLYLCIKLI